MATKHIRVRLSFTHGSDHQIEEAAGAVITGMTGNKNYPNPPVDLAEVQAALTAFTAALAAQPSGGVHATANKNKKRRDKTPSAISLYDCRSYDPGRGVLSRIGV